MSSLASALLGSTRSFGSAQNQFAPVRIVVTPIQDNSDRGVFEFPKYIPGTQNLASGFLDYDFDSNILIPADSFTFTFAAPQDENPYDLIREGDQINLLAGPFTIATGIIDAVDLRVDAERGEIVTIRGRDFLGQLADQSSVLDTGKPLFGGSIALNALVVLMTSSSSIKSIHYQNANSATSLFVSTMPEESKLSTLVTYLSSFNYLFWMLPDGRLSVGRPNFQSVDGILYCNKNGSEKNKDNNVLSYRVSRSATQIPNRIVVLYTGQEAGAVQAPKSQILNNTAPRPQALRNAGYSYSKCITASFIGAPDPVSLDVATSLSNLSSTGTKLQAYASRVLARANMQEIECEVEVPGHLNPSGLPYVVDTNYRLEFDRANLTGDKFYLYSVRYRLDPHRGQTTILNFCPQNTIVSYGVQSTVTSS